MDGYTWDRHLHFVTHFLTRNAIKNNTLLFQLPSLLIIHRDIPLHAAYMLPLLSNDLAHYTDCILGFQFANRFNGRLTFEMTEKKNPFCFATNVNKSHWNQT